MPTTTRINWSDANLCKIGTFGDVTVGEALKLFSGTGGRYAVSTDGETFGMRCYLSGTRVWVDNVEQTIDFSPAASAAADVTIKTGTTAGVFKEIVVVHDGSNSTASWLAVNNTFWATSASATPVFRPAAGYSTPIILNDTATNYFHEQGDWGNLNFGHTPNFLFGIPRNASTSPAPQDWGQGYEWVGDGDTLLLWGFGRGGSNGLTCTLVTDDVPGSLLNLTAEQYISSSLPTLYRISGLDGTRHKYRLYIYDIGTAWGRACFSKSGQAASAADTTTRTAVRPYAALGDSNLEGASNTSGRWASHSALTGLRMKIPIVTRGIGGRTCTDYGSAPSITHELAGENPIGHTDMINCVPSAIFLGDWLDGTNEEADSGGHGTYNPPDLRTHKATMITRLLAGTQSDCVIVSAGMSKRQDVSDVRTAAYALAASQAILIDVNSPRVKFRSFQGSYYGAAQIHYPDASHAKRDNMVAPYLVAVGTPGYTVTEGPSGTLTVRLANSANFTGEEEITVNASAGTVTATAVGGTVTNNTTASVKVKPVADASSFTFHPSATCTLSFSNTVSNTVESSSPLNDPANVAYVPDPSPHRQLTSVGVG